MYCTTKITTTHKIQWAATLQRKITFQELLKKNKQARRKLPVLQLQGLAILWWGTVNINEGQVLAILFSNGGALDKFNS